MILTFPVCGAEARPEDSIPGNGPRLYAESYAAHLVGHGPGAGAVDIFAAEGAHVHSPTRGTVESTGSGGAGGHHVWIRDDQRERHYFAHMRDAALVHEGDHVEPGQLLGYVGRTGNARTTGPHLHYAVYDKDGHAYDPSAALLRLVLGREVTYFRGDIREDWNGPVACPVVGRDSPLASYAPPDRATEENVTLRVTDGDGRGVGILILAAAALAAFGGK